MPKVDYNPGLRSPSVFCSARFHGVDLDPGINDVSQDDLTQLRSHPVFKSWEAQGIVTIISKEASETIVPPEEAEEIEQSPDLLQPKFTLDE